MITGKQVVSQYREVEASSKGEVSHIWSRIKAAIHCQIKFETAEQKLVSDRDEYFVEAVLKTSYPDFLFRDVVFFKSRAYRIEAVNLREGAQNIYECELKRDNQAETEILQVV